MTTTACAWWHNPKPAAIDPLDAVRITAQCLEDGQPVPTAAAALVAAAFRQYLGGRHDISHNLGLRPRRGGRHETPVAAEEMKQRNTIIKSLADRYEGNKTQRCEAVAQTLKAVRDEGRVTEEQVLGYILRLREMQGLSMPTSMRQVLRIVDGK